MPIASLVLALIAAIGGSEQEASPPEQGDGAEAVAPEPAPVAASPAPAPAPAPAVSPSPAPAPAPAPTYPAAAPAPAPTYPAAAPPSASPVAAPYVPQQTGLGLLIAGPLTVAVGLPFSLLGNKAWRDNCGPYSSNRECADGTLASGAGHTVAGLAFATGMSLTAVGGSRRGRHDGRQDPSREGAGFIAGGAILLPVSLIGMGMVRLFMWLPTPDCQTYDCVATSQITSTAVVSSLALTASAGAGLLMYGVAYNKSKRTPPPVALLPQAGRGYAGLNLMGQF